MALDAGVSPKSLVFAPFIRDADFAARAPWQVPGRRLLDFLMVYVAEGRCRFTVEGVAHEPRVGTFCLVQPGESVLLQGFSHTVTPYAHFDLWFCPRRDESFATRPGQFDLTSYSHLLQARADSLGALPTVFEPPDEDFKTQWLEIVEQWSRGDELSRLEAQNWLGTLIFRLVRHFAAPRSASAPNFLAWVPSFLSTHLGKSPSVEEMARRARLSPSRFTVVFRQQFGTSPARYLLEMRLHHAAELLRSTDWTLAHIASLCGFADVHHFAKAFKKRFKTPPGKYRSRG